MTNEEYAKWKVENDKKWRRRERHVKGLRGFIIGAALSLGAIGIAEWKHYDDTHLSYSEIINEMVIHSYHGIDPSGHRIEPAGHDGCDIPDDGEEHVYFTDRLIEAMKDEYSPEVIRKTAILFPDMCSDNPEVREAAKEQLESIGDQLEKGEDGKYHLPIKNTKTR